MTGGPMIPKFASEKVESGWLVYHSELLKALMKSARKRRVKPSLIRVSLEAEASTR